MRLDTRSAKPTGSTAWTHKLSEWTTRCFPLVLWAGLDGCIKHFTVPACNEIHVGSPTFMIILYSSLTRGQEELFSTATKLACIIVHFTQDFWDSHWMSAWTNITSGIAHVALVLLEEILSVPTIWKINVCLPKPCFTVYFTGKPRLAASNPITPINVITTTFTVNARLKWC